MRSIKTKLFSLAMAVSMVLALAGCAMSTPSTVGYHRRDRDPGRYLPAGSGTTPTTPPPTRQSFTTGETASDVKAVLKATCTGTIGDEGSHRHRQ